MLPRFPILFHFLDTSPPSLGHLLPLSAPPHILTTTKERKTQEETIITQNPAMQSPRGLQDPPPSSPLHEEEWKS